MLNKAIGIARKTSAVVTAVVMIAVGLAFAGFAGFVLSSEDVGDKNLVEVQATVVSVDHAASTMQVTYSYGGQNFTEVDYPGYDSRYAKNDTMPIYINADNPSEIVAKGSKLFVILFFVLGGAAVLGGIYTLVRALKAKASDYDEYTRVDFSGINAAEAESVQAQAASAEHGTYLFRFDTNFKQGYYIEDEQHVKIYEIKMVKMTLFTPYTFQFINHVSGEVKTVSVGHTVTTSVGSGSGGIHTEITESSRFTVNGKNNWDYIGERGWSIGVRLNGIFPIYDICHLGIKVATLETPTIGEFNAGKKPNLLSGMPCGGCFRVICDTGDLDMVALIAFCLTRCD